jgi:hypothetical protein
MGKTYNTKHQSPSRRKRRGPKNRDYNETRDAHKPVKQRRARDRQRLRKEWL